MNRIQKIVFTLACLLTATGAWAGDYTIRLNTPSNGTMTSEVTTANHGVSVPLTVTPIDNYYLSELYYEKVVTDIGGAESPRRRSPGFSEKTIIPIKTTVPSYITSHYGGTYNISMPPYDIEVTAIFTPCTSIDGATLHWDSSSSSTSITYDGYEHTANVYLGSSDLSVNANYTINTDKLTNVGSITPTITGVGTYCGTINDQTILITQKTLNIAADADQSKIYGDSDPTFTYTQTGLCSGDQITGELSRAVGENVGSYAINKGTLTAGNNYSISFIPQNFAINAKDLSAVALNITLDHDYFNENGNVQKAQITGITYGNTTLNSGSDYNSTFNYGTGVYGKTDNTAPDIYPITVSFIGNYTGTKTVEYQIRPEITLNNSNDHKWRTFYEPKYNLDLTDDFRAYTISNITTNAVILDGPTVVKAATPMVLFRTGNKSNGIYPPLIKSTDSRLTGAPWTGVYANYKCKLDNVGMPKAWDLTDDNDIQNGNKIIMILVDDKFARTKSGTLAAGKCYLDVTGTSFAAPMLALQINLTGIDEIDARNQRTDNHFYDLSGRRVMNPTKGLYIVNGKKIIIK